MADSKKILVVEDDNALRVAIRDTIKDAGYEVFEAIDGEDGLKLALEIRPDLIVLDVLLPNMNGEKVLKQLRDNDWGKDIPIILLTNMSYLQDEESKNRSSEYMLKADTELDELVEKIHSYLKKDS